MNRRQNSINSRLAFLERVCHDVWQKVEIRKVSCSFHNTKALLAQQGSSKRRKLVFPVRLWMSHCRCALTANLVLALIPWNMNIGKVCIKVSLLWKINCNHGHKNGGGRGPCPLGLWNFIFCYKRFSSKMFFLSIGVGKIKFHHCCPPL